jgi:hypothetical protein
MSLTRIAALALGAALLSSPAAAQPAAAPSGSDEVVVTAIRPAQMRDFVRQLAETGKQDQMSRWDGKVCPGVVGVQTAAAQALIDQIALRAISIGLEAGRPGCRANVLVIVTPDASTFTPAFVDQNKRFFSYNEDNGNALGRQALEAFANSRAPVRWWHVSQTVTDRGQVLGQSDAVGGDGDFSNAQVARVTNSGRLRGGTRQEFNRVIIIVDSAGIAGRPFPAVADYIAMVSLAQIRPDADRSRLDTVLNLFDASEGVPQGWTAWDAAYVKGLYDADRFAASARLQENAIVRRVEKERGAEPETVPPPPR